MTDRLLLDTHAALRLDGGGADLAAAIRAPIEGIRSAGSARR